MISLRTRRLSLRTRQVSPRTGRLSSRTGRLSLRALRARPRDQRGSLPVAMLLTVVAVSLSALLVPVSVNQITATRTTSESTLALDAARAGLNSAMGQLRAAVTGTGAGDLSQLPAGPLTGNVGPDGSQRYQVTISYRDLDGATVLMPSIIQPVSAVVSSTGIASATGTFASGTAKTRTLRATYSFRLSNEIFPGGQIHVRGSSTDLCLDAGSARPAAGTPVVLQACTASSAQQFWAYKNDLTLVLVSSQTGSLPLGMCLDAGSPHVAGTPVKVQPCAGISPPPAAQRWSLNGAANFLGTTSGAVDSFCFTATVSAGSALLISDRATCGVFQLDSAVGAGAAGTATKQLVSYQQFGRCLDLTNADVAATYLIARPCVQAPDPTTIGWNQKWTWPAVSSATGTGTGRIYTTLNGNDYCLRSSGTTSVYPTVTACTAATVTAAMTWTVYGSTGSYAGSYQVVDNAGLCLQPADPAASPTEVYSTTGLTVSRVVMRTCDGSGWQKWNAPAYLAKPLPLSQITER